MKYLWQSKTVWINILITGVAYVLNHKGAMAALGLDADTQILILSIANILNRWLGTSEPVTVKA